MEISTWDHVLNVVHTISYSVGSRYNHLGTPPELIVDLTNHRRV